MPTDVTERFGFLLRACRLDNEMTQEDLAKAVGVHQPSVSAWELGRTLPAPGTLLELARLFNLDLAALADPPELSTTIRAAIE